MKKLYSTSVTATGGRNGHVKSADGVLDADVRMPKSLGGGEGNHLNPETLFAAGYAACFDNALLHIMQMEKLSGVTSSTTAEVDLVQPVAGGGFALEVTLHVEISGLDAEKKQELVNKAHAVCPYSNATRGNIDVKLNIK